MKVKNIISYLFDILYDNIITNVNFTLNRSKILFIFIVATIFAFVGNLISPGFGFITIYIGIGMTTRLLTTGNDFVNESLIMAIFYSILIYTFGYVFGIFFNNLLFNVLIIYSLIIPTGFSLLTDYFVRLAVNSSKENQNEERVKPEEKPKKELDINKDEKVLIELLEKNNGKIRQKNITNHIDWHASKVSKISIDLEEKDLIRKEKEGRENIIHLNIN